jgi:hypothetical protein
MTDYYLNIEVLLDFIKIDELFILLMIMSVTPIILVKLINSWCNLLERWF